MCLPLMKFGYVYFSFLWKIVLNIFQMSLSKAKFFKDFMAAIKKSNLECLCTRFSKKNFKNIFIYFKKIKFRFLFSIYYYFLHEIDKLRLCSLIVTLRWFNLTLMRPSKINYSALKWTTIHFFRFHFNHYFSQGFQSFLHVQLFFVIIYKMIF